MGAKVTKYWNGPTPARTSPYRQPNAIPVDDAMVTREELRVPADLLAPDSFVKRLGFSDTSTIPPLDQPVGHERALEALEFGLRMKGHGFNLYASGPAGTGKWSIIKPLVDRLARQEPSPPDWCYVHNFRDPSSPRCLSFPPGQGRHFQREMAALIRALGREIPRAFESPKYLDARAKILEERDTTKQALFRAVEAEVQALGFGFKEEPVGFSLAVMKDGHLLSDEELASLPEAERVNLMERRKEVERKLREFHARTHALDHEAEARLREMDSQVIRALMHTRLAALKDRYHELPEVLDYLTQVAEDIVTNYKDFLPQERAFFPFPFGNGTDHRPSLHRYRVNVLVEHHPDAGAPVIEESHPTYSNLIGKIERRSQFGAVYTDFMDIKAGACLHANGGYLILHVLDVLRQPFAWDALKRVIKTQMVHIEDPSEYFGFPTVSLKPQPIPVSIKVILLGPPLIFYLLETYEEDFPKIFKVRMDFDRHMPHDLPHEEQYARLIAKICHDEHLPHFHVDAVAEIIRYGLRLAERRDRLSLRLRGIADLVRESAYWASQAGHTLVTRADVETALTRKRRRMNLLEEWIQDEIQEGTLLVDLTGAVVGQVNGLSVHHWGEYAFGRPCRITARTFVGTKGVIDIQREAELAGHIHSKGVMTLAGYLAGKFAGTHPFALSATLTFEQTYSEVDGDSAAVAELAAILSSLANVPIRQDLAVTGSVNQLGEVQPIGGVNEKIEGFYESCRRHGLTGEQGVIIPARNIKHLALRQDVVDAVMSGRFHIYGVHTIEETLELLTGVQAGSRDSRGQYPEDSLFGLADRRLAEMAQLVSQWGDVPQGTTAYEHSGRSVHRCRREDDHT
ncbi:MAG: ATP-binding protein [Nitrospirae bacterium]|nr:MAG: ATP-binding protein [Nitrospirota bacterium]